MFNVIKRDLKDGEIYWKEWKRLLNISLLKELQYKKTFDTEDQRIKRTAEVSWGWTLWNVNWWWLSHIMSWQINQKHVSIIKWLCTFFEFFYFYAQDTELLYVGLSVCLSISLSNIYHKLFANSFSIIQ